jgi:hypothetical protein
MAETQTDAQTKKKADEDAKADEKAKAAEVAAKAQAQAEPETGGAVDPQDRYRNPSNPDVDVRLDDRTGSARPPLEEFPAVPQQVDGPDVEHQAQHTADHMAKLAKGDDEDDVPRKGARSLGPHGLGEDGEDE